VELIRGLKQRLTQEMAAVKGQAPSETAEPAGPEAEEAKALSDALARTEGLLQQADEASTAALSALKPAEAPLSPTPFKQVLKTARPDQVRARDALADALGELERARLPLGQLAHRVMTMEGLLLSPVRELAAARTVEAQGKKIEVSDLRQAQEKVSPYVARMPGALRRDLERMRPHSEEGKPVPEEQQKQFEQAKSALEGLVEQVKAGDAAATEKLKAGDVSAGRDAIDQAYLAARRVWMPWAEFKALLEQAISEEGNEIARSRGFASAAQSPADDQKKDAILDQSRTRELLPAILMQAQAQEAAAQKAQAQGGQGQAAPAPSGLPKEVIDLAKKNVPLSESAMKDAEAKLETRSWADAADRQDEAKRLLEEILKKLQEEQQKDQQQKPPQPQPQEMSPEERERLARAVEERSRKMREEREKMRKPAPVEEDW
jgi:hypothetical protein